MDEPVPIPIGDVFDLHSVPPRDAETIVIEYLSEARRLGYRAVRIIHGRGIGAQREMVRRVMAGTPFVTSFGTPRSRRAAGGRRLRPSRPKREARESVTCT
jgi:DNA-nicking Smr family endonuclease